MIPDRIGWLGRTVLALLLAIVLAGTAQAEKRVALVIGQSGYRSVQAPRNPGNDARLVADRLRASGFSLVGGGPQVDLDRPGFDRVLQEFADDTVGADVALFYYSGHGVQILDTNWLLPVEANPQKPADLLSQGVDVAEILKRMELSQAKLKIVLLDACRNNPFLDRGLRSAEGRGLMRMDAPDGTVISYATKPGHVAQDGDGDDSPYTTALASVMRQPGVPILNMFNQLGLAVQHTTGGSQEPWLAASPIDDRFTFMPASAPDASASPSLPGTRASPPAFVAATVAASGAAPADAGSTVAPHLEAAAALDSSPTGTSQTGQGATRQIGEWIEQSFAVPHDTPVHAAPSDDAQNIAQLHAGGSVFVEAALDQQPWLQVRLGEGQPTGFVRADAIPTDAPKPPAAHPAAPTAISGRPIVHDTATLLVETHLARLAGIEGFGGDFADGLQHFLDGVGDFVSCSPVDAEHYRCFTRDGVDVATVALVNGAARLAGGDAPDAYRVQQDDAQHNGRGIWASAAPPPPPPPPLVLDPAFTVADPVILPDAWDYGFVEVDGLPVTVIDGERVAFVYDDALGWGYRDRRGWHGAPDRLRHDLQLHYRDHAPHGPNPRFTRVADRERFAPDSRGHLPALADPRGYRSGPDRIAAEVRERSPGETQRAPGSPAAAELHGAAAPHGAAASPRMAGTERTGPIGHTPSAPTFRARPTFAGAPGSSGSRYLPPQQSRMGMASGPSMFRGPMPGGPSMFRGPMAGGASMFHPSMPTRTASAPVHVCGKGRC